MPMILLATPGWGNRRKHPQHIKSGYASNGTIWKPGLNSTPRVGAMKMKSMYQLTRSNNSASVLRDPLMLPRSESSLEIRSILLGKSGLQDNI